MAKQRSAMSRRTAAFRRTPFKMPTFLAGIFHSQSYGANGMVHGAGDMVDVQLAVRVCMRRTLR